MFRERATAALPSVPGRASDRQVNCPIFPSMATGPQQNYRDRLACYLGKQATICNRIKMSTVKKEKERKGDNETAKGIKVYFRKMVGWRRGLFFSLSILSCAFLKHGGLRSSRERALVQHLNLEISKCIYIACRLYSGYVLECDPQNSLGMLSRIALLLQIRKLMQVGFSLIQPQNLLIIVFY